MFLDDVLGNQYFSLAVHNPHEYALHILKKALEKTGIQVEENFYLSDSNDCIEIVQILSDPLSKLLQTMNKNSDNLIAGILFKYCGKKLGKRESSEEAARMLLSQFLAKLGFDPTSYVFYEGAGLSRHNLVTPYQTVLLLDYFNNDKNQFHWKNSLAISRVDGTLANRFFELPSTMTIYAKTGGMSNTANLAGYLEMNQRKIIFAIFINNSLYPWAITAKTLDALLIQLLSHFDGI